MQRAAWPYGARVGVPQVSPRQLSVRRSNLMFMLVSRRYERASLIVTSNKPFSAWGGIFGDDVTARDGLELAVLLLDPREQPAPRVLEARLIS